MERPAHLTALLEQIGTAEDLGALLDAIDPAQVAEIVRQLGADDVLDRVFSVFPERLDPNQLGPGTEATVQWNIRLDDRTHHWVVLVADEECQARRGAVNRPTVSLSMELLPFLRLVTARLGSMEAFLSGALRVSGDRLVALRLDWWFGLAAEPAGKRSGPPAIATIGLHALRQVCDYTWRTTTAGWLAASEPPGSRLRLPALGARRLALGKRPDRRPARSRQDGSRRSPG